MVSKFVNIAYSVFTGMQLNFTSCYEPQFYYIKSSSLLYKTQPLLLMALQVMEEDGTRGLTTIHSVLGTAISHLCKLEHVLHGVNSFQNES